MLAEARKALYTLVLTAWPTGAIILAPESRTPFEDALQQARANDDAVVRFHAPQLQRAGGISQYLCSVDVCHPDSDRAGEEADRLLQVIGTHQRTPSGVIGPRAVPLRESTYERVSVSFTILLASVSTPPTPTSS